MATSDEATLDEQRCGPAVWVLLAITLLGGIALRLVSFRGSLWLDELHTAWAVSGNLADVAPRAMLGNQPPLPYWLLWIYVQFSGISEWSLRLPSLVASSASILVAFWVAWRWLQSPIAGLVAAAAIAVEGTSALFFASEARVYAAVQLLALVQLAAFESVLRTGSKRARLASLSLALLLFYVHYTTLLLLAAEFIAWVVIRLSKGPSQYRPGAVAIDTSIFCLGCLPAFAHLRLIFERRENWEAFIGRPGFDDVITIVPHHQMLAVLTGAWLVWMGVNGWGAHAPSLRWPQADVAGLLLAWLIVPIAIAWTLSQTDVARLFHLRYLAFVLPAGGMLLAMLVAMMPLRRTQWLAAVGTAFCLAGWHFSICYPVLYGWEPVRTEDWRGAIRRLNRRTVLDGQPLLVASQLIEADALRDSNDPALREYCLFPLRAAYPLTDDGGFEEIPLPYTDPGKLNSEQKALVNAWFAKEGLLLVLVRGSKDYAREVANDVEDSLDKKVDYVRFREHGDLWVIVIIAQAH